MLDLHADGCIAGNIRTRPYVIHFTAKCSHTKVLSAQITINAENAADALAFARTYLHLGPLRGQTVVERVEEA